MPTNIELEKMVKDNAIETAQLRDTLTEVVETVNSQDTKLDQILAAMTAQNHPSGERQHILEPAEHDPNEYGMAQDAADGIEQTRLTSVDSPEFQAKAEILRFMQDRLHIVIHETSEKDADQAFEVSVNNRSMMFQRGHEYPSVPRMYVEGLARAKPVTYVNEEYTMNNGARAMRWPSRRGLRYPFSVLKDPAGEHGERWLKSVLAQP